MAFDPCNLVPDSVIPVGLPPPSQHAIHHVIGRIRHRVRPHGMHAKLAPMVPNADGCERTAKLGTSLLRATPAGPALAAISGAGGAAIGGFGGYTAGRATREHKHRDHGHDGRTPVPEPASALLFMTAVLICVVGRRFLHRQTKGRMFFFEKKNQKTLVR